MIILLLSLLMLPSCKDEADCFKEAFARNDWLPACVASLHTGKEYGIITQEYSVLLAGGSYTFEEITAQLGTYYLYQRICADETLNDSFTDNQTLSCVCVRHSNPPSRVVEFYAGHYDGTISRYCFSRSGCWKKIFSYNPLFIAIKQAIEEDPSLPHQAMLDGMNFSQIPRSIAYLYDDIVAISYKNFILIFDANLENPHKKLLIANNYLKNIKQVFSSRDTLIVTTETNRDELADNAYFINHNNLALFSQYYSRSEVPKNIQQGFVDRENNKLFLFTNNENHQLTQHTYCLEQQIKISEKLLSQTLYSLPLRDNFFIVPHQRYPFIYFNKLPDRNPNTQTQALAFKLYGHYLSRHPLQRKILLHPRWFETFNYLPEALRKKSFEHILLNKADDHWHVTCELTQYNKQHAFSVKENLIKLFDAPEEL